MPFCAILGFPVYVPEQIVGGHNREQGGSVCMGGCSTLSCFPLLISILLITKYSSSKWKFLPCYFGIISVIIITGKVGQFAWAAAPPCCVLLY